MIIRDYQDQDKDAILPLIANFRVELANLKGLNKKPDLTGAETELNDYLEEKFPIYVAIDDNDDMLGYAVCRIMSGVVWAESMFVRKGERRRGIGCQLFQSIESLARELGNDTVYNWVHPNNEKSINFLKRMGYNVLNLVEIRKKHPGEVLEKKIVVDKYEFDY